MNYREKMREYLKEPDEYSSQYGKWGALNREQRQMITRLLNEMDRADEFIKHQFFEIERLKKENEELKDLYNRTCKHLFNIGNDELARYFQAQISNCNVFTPQILDKVGNSNDK